MNDPFRQSADSEAPATVAAVDLGSNSFHLIVARFSGARLLVVDRIKDMVRLAAGLDEKNLLSEDVMKRALDCLERFGERLRGMDEANVRVVGTNTLRRARNGEAFIERARQALGYEVEIISGREEARLIYLGVSHSLEDNWDRRLVVDIGGGSTELILGRQFQPEKLESLYMGCVGVSNEFFPKGDITAGAMKAAELFALQELEPLETAYRARGWDSAIGASGTILAVQEVCTAQGWSSDQITREALKTLRKRLIEVGHVERLELEGLPKQRAPVFPGGVAILSGIFRALDIDRMQVSSGALREGLLWDLLGRRYRADIRERTIDDLVRRYHVDADQALRVQDTALDLLNAVAEAWEIDLEEYAPLLRWAAHLHEIGMDIAHSQYHKHGGYLLQYMDMPGFSRNEQQKLALLVRGHRRKFPAAEFEAVSADHRRELLRLALLLRCAVAIHRSRDPDRVPRLQAVQATPDTMTLILPNRWLRDHALMRLDLAQEARNWASLGLDLTFTDLDKVKPPPELMTHAGHDAAARDTPP